MTTPRPTEPNARSLYKHNVRRFPSEMVRLRDALPVLGVPVDVNRPFRGR